MKKNRKFLMKILKSRISNLLHIALRVYEVEPELSRLYVKMAFSLVKRYKVKLDNLKWNFCRKCFIPWIENKTVRIRSVGKFKIYSCINCAYERRRYSS